MYVRRMSRGKIDAYMKFNFEVCGREQIKLAYTSAALNINLLTWTGLKNIVKISAGSYMPYFKSTSRLCVARQFNLVDTAGVPFVDENVVLDAAENYTISISTLEPRNFSLMLQPFGHLSAEPLPFNIRIDPNLELMRKLD